MFVTDREVKLQLTDGSVQTDYFAVNNYFLTELGIACH